MSKKEIGLLWGIAFLVFLLGIFFKTDVQIEDVKVEEGIPEKIVVLLPSVQEMLSELGLNDKIVGTSQHSVYPDEILKKEKIANFNSVNYEKIVKLEPDIVIGTDAIKEISSKSKKLGLKYIELKDSTIEDILNTIIEIGKIFGVEKKSSELVNKLTSSMDLYSKELEEVKNNKILIVIGTSGNLQNVYVAGKNNFFDQVLKRLGLQNSYTGNMLYPQVSPEDIINMNPDHVIILDAREELNSEEKTILIKDWKKLPLNASKNNNIHVVNGNHVFLPGPRFIKLFEQFRDCIK